MGFNPDKFMFRADTIKFAGFNMTGDGYKPMKKMLDSITNFPILTNLTGIRSWFRLVQQVAYAFSRTEAMAPFRNLLKRNVKFYWDDHLLEQFLKSCKVIVEAVKEGVKAFEIEQETMLVGDWSETGVGFMLEQKHCECDMKEAPYCGPGHWKLVLVGSKFNNDSESRYAPVEGEALAMVLALESTRLFTLGNPNLIVETDHKAPVNIMGPKLLHAIRY